MQNHRNRQYKGRDMHDTSSRFEDDGISELDITGITFWLDSQTTRTDGRAGRNWCLVTYRVEVAERHDDLRTVHSDLNVFSLTFR